MGQPRPRNTISPAATELELISELGQGHGGATAVLTRLVKSYGQTDFLAVDDMNMRGVQIYAAFVHCGEDYPTLIEKIAARDKSMVAAVNEICGSEAPEPAVTSGGSNR